MKALSTEKDLLLKIDKFFSWETFRGKLESLYSKRDVILLFKILIIKFIYNISWLEGEIRDSKMLMPSWAEKSHQRAQYSTRDYKKQLSMRARQCGQL
ncbi:hypothetical protein [Saccharolobus islandicus]|uniref:hypothetical protein n=1 Tax=Saccharolobus islandicus TaxID=43080 RepID=UPI001CEF99AA|nr:hypothetical protein [Sulfolobus islandicus]